MNKEKPTVLVVDDVADNIQILLSALKNDFSILAATNGKDAIELSLSEHQPDIILLDILMPEMDGYEVCRRLKADERTKDIPVVFVTILDENESELKGLKLGAVDYITKPIIPELVKARISNHLELKQQRETIEQSLAQEKLLQAEIQKQTKRIEEQHIKLIQKSRLAQIGEMISMIAHQWRQPLSTVSITSSNIQIMLELEKFDLDTKEGQVKQNRYIIKELRNIDGYVQNLSTTIDDFRNFYKQNKNSVTLKIEEVISKSLGVIKASLINNNIEIIEEHNSKEEIELYDTEMMQVIINILKNAQDNFKEKQTNDPYIRITTENKTISICDNGGGIPEDIIEKVFDPYFSTKDEKNGIGLGLYMSKTIIEEHHNGSLIVENIDDGVCFTIEIGLLSIN